MKVKCLTTTCDVVIDKIYDVVDHCSEGFWVAVIDDAGDEMCLFHNMGEFEVVE